MLINETGLVKVNARLTTTGEAPEQALVQIYRELRGPVYAPSDAVADFLRKTPQQKAKELLRVSSSRDTRYGGS